MSCNEILIYMHQFVLGVNTAFYKKITMMYSLYNHNGYNCFE